AYRSREVDHDLCRGCPELGPVSGYPGPEPVSAGGEPELGLTTSGWSSTNAAMVSLAAARNIARLTSLSISADWPSTCAELNQPPLVRREIMVPGRTRRRVHAKSTRSTPFVSMISASP